MLCTPNTWSLWFNFHKPIKTQSLLLQLLDMTKSLQNEITCQAKAPFLFLSRFISSMHHPLAYMLCLAAFVSNRPKALKIVFVPLKRKDEDMMDKYWYRKTDNSTHLEWILTTLQLNTKAQNYRILFYLGKQGHLPTRPFPQTLSTWALT